MRYIRTACEAIAREVGVTASLLLIGAMSILPFGLLSGCATKPEVKIEKVYETVPVMVATGCIATTGRPEPVRPLKDTVTADEWAARAPGAKAQSIAAQAGARMNYEDQDRAATSGCK